MYVQKLASAVKNNVVSGLRGLHHNLSLPDKLIEDYVVQERLQVLKEYSLKGILPVKDLYISINCIPVDCKSIERCNCDLDEYADKIAHFEIPQLLNDYNSQSIDYIGSTDKQLPFVYYTSITSFKNHKYRKRGKTRPYVWIDTTPNENGMYDCFVYNAPMLNLVSVTAIFKDLRLLDNYECCIDNKENISFIDNEVIRRLSEKLIRWYRLLATPLSPNDQTYNPG